MLKCSILFMNHAVTLRCHAFPILSLYFVNVNSTVNVLTNGCAVKVGKRSQRKNHLCKSKMEAIPKTHEGIFSLSFFFI